MLGSDQIPSSIFTSNPRKENSNGYSGSKCTYKIWNVAFYILGYQVKGNNANGYAICYYPNVWCSEKVVQRKQVEIHD